MFSHPEERDEFPWFSHRYCLDKPSSRSMCPNRLLVRVLSCIVLFLTTRLGAVHHSSVSPTSISFADTRSHSPTTVAHGSITHTRTIIAPIPSIVKPAMLIKVLYTKRTIPFQGVRKRLPRGDLHTASSGFPALSIRFSPSIRGELGFEELVFHYDSICQSCNKNSHFGLPVRR